MGSWKVECGILAILFALPQAPFVSLAANARKELSELSDP